MDEPKYTWHAVGVDGHREKLGGDFLYTSIDAPIEADTYERMRQRAEAAEQQVQKLTAMLNGQERLAQENTKEFDKVLAGLNQGVMVSAGLYHQWRDADERAKKAEARVKELETQLGIGVTSDSATLNTTDEMMTYPRV